MKLSLLVLLLLPALLFSQTVDKPYFQQEVNYKIVVSLDDEHHILNGSVEFEYINHSPDVLSEIWVHVWGNAFKNRNTAFCRQKLREGSSRFYFAKERDLGYYKGLDFQSGGQTLEWEYDKSNPDIALIRLPKPLEPGQKISIQTPMELKIPASFSRLGHVETSYQMTQWYPKPAVYDNKGWHQMPYLDMGEFYSEFGSFDVSITLPENYVVGATGVLQTPSEIEFLRKKEIESREILAGKVDVDQDIFPASSTKMKTIRYNAERVHDFAWFADKRFFVLKDTATLASGRTVDCWAMFPKSESEIWKQGAFYVKRAVEFYSEKVGDYPYPHATAVHSALSAGGGMEYPMITVIGDSGDGKNLDRVITHEVGHNWFYGILASNERDHPFMDEGLNSYYEDRYMGYYYGDSSPLVLPKKLYDPMKYGPTTEMGYLILALNHLDTPPDSHSNDFNELAYGLQVYMKTAACMRWLENSVGTDRFDDAMHDYYKKWQFKHPYPEDFRTVLEDHQLDVDWFFEAIQTKKRADYSLKKVSDQGNGEWKLEVKRKGELNSPFPVSAIRNGSVVKTVWNTDLTPVADTEPESRKQHYLFSVNNPDAFVIDNEFVTLDLNRKDNWRRSSGALSGTDPFQLKLLAPFQDVQRNTLGVFPWLGWNNADKTMVGLIFYKPFLPPRSFQFYLLPGYGIGSKQVVGLADVRYSFVPGGFIQKVTLGASAKSFDYDYIAEKDKFLRFYRFVPQIKAELRSNSLSYHHNIAFRTLFLNSENAVYNDIGYVTIGWGDLKTIYELKYEGKNDRLPNPFNFQVSLESQQYKTIFKSSANYLLGNFEWKQQFYYKRKKKITARFYAGYFLHNTLRNNSVLPPYYNPSLNAQGFNDYKYDQTFLARSGGAGILGRQVNQSGGGFKGAFGPAYAYVFGNSNNFITSINLKSDLPFRLPLKLPVKPYFDIGYFDDASSIGEAKSFNDQFVWSGGLMLEFLKGGLEVYFPIVNSDNLKSLYCEQAGGTNKSALFCGGNYLKMISWSFKINSIDPVNIIMDVVR
ncbi:MAG: M1 family metallopeptidase [Saprospiraceae bacterium]|nr:M1 family metallopeptidase [Saprospiraceae bacterium]MCB9343853.1 M1 family metallopeptidase [Lewinellaceae bacterium]